MPFDVDALQRTEEITNKSVPFNIPAMDDDEWIKIRAIRDGLEDFNAHVLAMGERPKVAEETKPKIKDGDIIPEGEEDPDVAEAENIAEQGGKLAVNFVADEGMRYLYIWRYMCLDFNCYALPTEAERADGQRRGRKLDPHNQKDVDNLFRIIGEDLINLMAAKDGSVRTPDVKGPDGKMAGFREADGVGKQGSTPTSQDTGGDVLVQPGTADQNP